MKRLPIVGAGLAGLLAAHFFPGSEVFESSPEPRENHRALLRFRSDAVSNLTGIPFRKVLVRKSIFFKGQHVPPDLRLANLYSQKLFGTGVVGLERSIWNLDPVTRFVAPDDFYDQLIDRLNGKTRIHWNHPFTREEFMKGCISTIPMPAMMRAMELGQDDSLNFRFSPIKVVRLKIEGADAFQTVYFPEEETPLYRASITGDTFIAEFVGHTVGLHHVVHAMNAFGLEAKASNIQDVMKQEVFSQRYGKIIPIPSEVRKGLLFSLTHQFGIYSLGRFATWRNILLDDVVQDLGVIQSIIQSENAYDWKRRIILASEGVP